MLHDVRAGDEPLGEQGAAKGRRCLLVGDGDVDAKNVRTARHPQSITLREETAMKKLLITLIALLPMTAIAAQPQTLEQARQKAQKRVDYLNKMTPEQWDAKQKRRAEAKAKWEKLSPEEKAKKKAEFRARMEKHKDSAAAIPAPAAAQPAAGAPH